MKDWKKPEPITLSATNVVSLREAIFTDDGYIAYLMLLPRKKDDSSVFGFVYKHSIPFFKRGDSFYRKHRLAPISKYIKAIFINKTPEISFLWSESGESVAVAINGEPWAFLCEGKSQIYSKSIRKPIAGNPWDEGLFKKIF